MPTYEYGCSNCGHKMEAFQKITDSPLRVCPKCQKEALVRGPGGGIGISLQGEGFYKTMYPSTPDSGVDNKSTPIKDSGCCPCGKDKKCTS